MFSHLTLGVTDFDRAYRFYTAVLATLKLDLKFLEPETPCAGWMPPGQPHMLFVICHPLNGLPASAGNGTMAAFLATRDQVDACHAAALESGGTCEGPPGLRPKYHPDYYGAYFRDPDGNKICACCHEPASE